MWSREHDNRCNAAPTCCYRSKSGGASHHDLVALTQQHHVNESRPYRTCMTHPIQLTASCIYVSAGVCETFQDCLTCILKISSDLGLQSVNEATWIACWVDHLFYAAILPVYDAALPHQRSHLKQCVYQCMFCFVQVFLQPLFILHRILRSFLV